jgi:hypothetical protein
MNAYRVLVGKRLGHVHLEDPGDGRRLSGCILRKM